LTGAITGLILAGCVPQGPQHPAARTSPPPHLRSRGASDAPSLRPASADLSAPVAFSYTDSDDETSDCIFYAAGDAPVGLVVYLDGDGHPFHNQGGQSSAERSGGGLAGDGGVVEAAGARGYDVVSVRAPGDDGTWWLEDQDGKIHYLEQALDYVVAECGATTDRVWLVGYSGGSEFISQWFFPAYAERMAGGGFLLFGGGEARLVLTGGEILDAGVQVFAQPPGKKNASIHLLSGGEKALTAIALVFGIFKLNPAPFCLLDEVDAPLDDANTERYAKMVAAMSEETQFIFISHNKIAMEMAHQLIGVTMQEKGVSRLVAVDGLRCTEARLKTLLARKAPGETVLVAAFRRDELLMATVALVEAPGTIRLEAQPGAHAMRAAWLGTAQKRGGNKSSVRPSRRTSRAVSGKTQLKAGK